MANYVTAVEFSDITQLTAEEVGEMGNSSIKRDAKITEAQLEFERNVRVFTGAESDYTLAKRAVSFLAAHLLSFGKIGLISNGNIISPFLREYNRLVKMIKEAEPDTGEGLVFGGKISGVEVEERYSSSDTT